MYYEILIIAIIVFVIMIANGNISINKLINDNLDIFRKFKEDDWDFLVKARFGMSKNPDILFNRRIQKGLIVLFAVLVFSLGKFSIYWVIGALLGFYAGFKIDYIDTKSFYKRHVNEINAMLPHYLKSIEILIQHYTVPVALGKSFDDSPDIFKEGLSDLINSINSGDDSIKPYMEFAKKYPVRDSMRMMRLLYRLSIGRQENKQEQLLTFSKSISNLQQKARETKYKNRLDKMEGTTMKMLVSTGIGVMILLLLSVLNMINI